MAELSRRLSELDEGDYFHIAGWRVTPDQLLLGSEIPQGSFIRQIQELILRGVTVRALIWRPPGSSIGFAPGFKNTRENLRFVNAINRLGRPNGMGILDGRLSSGVSSHHQKTIVLSTRGEALGYVGGTDICEDRWDTPEHNSPPARLAGKYQAWHDVHCSVMGPAVAQLWDNFRERWNAVSRADKKTLRHRGNEQFSIGPNPVPKTDRTFGTHHVQVLRTLACGEVYPFAPSGEQTIKLAYERAIEKAKHYIYVEDQYLWPCSIIEKLAGAAARGVKIILVLARTFVPSLAPWHNSLRAQALDRVQKRHPQNVFAYHLQQPHFGSDIYVHSKLMIIDDRYVAVGSANINFRSLTTDSELQIGIVDDDTMPGTIAGQSGTICRFAKELRVTLWSEHLGLDDRSLIEDPIDSETGRPPCWPDSRESDSDAPLQRHHVVTHRVPDPKWSWPRWLQSRCMNPETIC